jgi:oligopeptide transport system permease protein
MGERAAATNHHAADDHGAANGHRATGKRPRSARGLRIVGRAALILLSTLAAISLLTIPFTARWFNVQSLDDAIRHAPAARPVVPFDAYAAESPALSDSPPLDTAGRFLHRTTGWLGYDDLGRSLLVRLGPALLVSLGLGLAAAGLALVIGVLWGTTAAWVGGRVDTIMMRVVDVLYSLPYLLTVILLKIALTRPLTALLGGQSEIVNLLILLLAIAGVSWLTMARVIRGQVLALKPLGFIEAARASGAGPIHMLRRHLLPNLAGPAFAYATLIVPQAVLQESFLSYLGIGVQQPMPSLGRLAADGVQSVNTFVGFWWLLVYPCGVLVTTLVALNFVGEALRERFDPRARSQAGREPLV